MLQWYTMDIAAMLHGITLAPLYNTLGPKTLAYVLNQTKAETLALVAVHVPTIVKLKVENKLPHLKNLILLDHLENANGADSHFALFTYE